VPNFIAWSILLIFYHEETQRYLQPRSHKLVKVPILSSDFWRSVCHNFHSILSRLDFQLKFVLVNLLRLLTRIWMQIGRNFNVIKLVVSN